MTNFTKLEPIPLPLNISSTTERRTYRQRNSADGKIFLSYREDIAVLNHFYRTLLKIAKSNYKKDSPKTTRKAYCKAIFRLILRLGKQILVEYNNQNVFFNTLKILNKSIFLIKNNTPKMT
ncbi:TPA: hypothetical protein U1673_001510 [Streptococcus suis]|uniref:hypothetical protein n=1 Tax=Streptococcus suis TaxID=1307 RepID=UPI001555DA21|nr:hypothetical protein [Streptococcus suis]NQG51631.1 hypothetical protein [Streptococcus suis]NQI28925.1 hypothetical protein [Streptococcus suis]NQQ35491.1 hypothetical protein [Streptococcus suis]NQQ61381.1 hypothetical protein [Streptococcus suis]NQS26058.1 hypothetical protein [Streptococcus suis]